MSNLTRNSVFGRDFNLHQKIDSTTGQLIATEYTLITANGDRYDMKTSFHPTRTGMNMYIWLAAHVHIGTPGLPVTQTQPAIHDNILTRIDNTLAQINSYHSSLGASGK
ncbi:MAG: hypothetical protein AB8W37_09125 [Arsenophonus endosymbiont of Dermacentor nuttalli]